MIMIKGLLSVCIMVCLSALVTGSYGLVLHYSQTLSRSHYVIIHGGIVQARGTVQFEKNKKYSQLQTGFTGGVTLGYFVRKSLTLEAELLFLINKDKQDSDNIWYNSNGLINTKYYFPKIDHKIYPWIGAGVGLSLQTSAAVSLRTLPRFYWQAMVGVDYQITMYARLGLSGYFIAGFNYNNAPVYQGVMANLMFYFPH